MYHPTMTSPNLSEPWNPERRWSYLVMAALTAMILVLLGERGHPGRHPLPVPETRIGLEARMEDWVLAAPKVLGVAIPKAAANPGMVTAQGWDQALIAVHAAENGDLDLGLKLAAHAPGATGDTFRQLWRWAYQGQGSAPELNRRREVAHALGDGYAARILEVRCLIRSGAPAQPLEEAVRQWARPRLALLGLACAAAMLLALAGLGFGLYLAVNPAPVRPLPEFHLPGRALAIVLLGWFLTLLVSGPAIGLVLAFLPFLRPIGLPLAYGFHACLGLTYLCAAEDLSFTELWRRAMAGSMPRALGSGLGFFALAFASVIAVAMLLSPLLRHAEPPQKELMELLGQVRGPLAVALVFLTLAVVAPIFEELLFRGFLLPWLGTRLTSRFGPRRGWLAAMAITAVTFGAMHMQPWGLPTLSTLGFVLGLAYVRTANLGAAILVHGLWNGGVFLILRLVAG